jgi:hypothetical protein
MFLVPTPPSDHLLEAEVSTLLRGAGDGPFLDTQTDEVGPVGYDRTADVDFQEHVDAEYGDVRTMTDWMIDGK